MNIPDPTKIPSTPICINRAASAGVAIPPAAKFTTGNLPVFFTSQTNSYGAPKFLASVISSSSSSLCIFLISDNICLA